MKIALLGAAGPMARIMGRDFLESADQEQFLLAGPDLGETTATLESPDVERLEAANVDARDIEATPGQLEGLRVEVQGMRAGKPVTHTLETLVPPHAALQVGAPLHLSAATTSLVAPTLARHEIASPNVLAPKHGLAPQAFFRRPGRRGIRLHSSVREDVN